MKLSLNFPDSLRTVFKNRLSLSIIIRKINLGIILIEFLFLVENFRFVFIIVYGSTRR